MSSRAALVREFDHGRANAIGPGLLAEVGSVLSEAEASGRPLVLTGTGRFFSAGLDLAGLPNGGSPEDRDELGAFVDDFDEVLERLFLLPCPTVAAVNGHAVAGGAILAAACDVRIGAAGDYRVGVSEGRIGVVFPATAFEILRAAVVPARAAEVLLRGRLGVPEEALADGFLHELAPPEALLGRALERAGELGALPRLAYSHTKRELREEFAERARARRAERREQFLDSWFSAESRARREAVLKRK